jgi:hypothetical protein
LTFELNPVKMISSGKLPSLGSGRVVTHTADKKKEHPKIKPSYKVQQKLSFKKGIDLGVQ